MIHTISGLMSGGKTLYASMQCYEDYKKGNKVYSNINLSFPHYKINNDYLLYLAFNNVDISNISFLLDEFWLFMDSRRSTSHLNVCTNWFFLQSSKGNNIKIYITSQTQGQLDIRIRNNQHLVSLCERKILYKGKLYNIPTKYKPYRKLIEVSEELELRMRILIKTFTQTMESDYKLEKMEIILPSKYYWLYNTNEKVINTKKANDIFIMKVNNTENTDNKQINIQEENYKLNSFFEDKNKQGEI